MENGWFHQPHRETRVEFEDRALQISKWIISLLESQPILPSSSSSTSPPDVSSSTAVFVLHGYLLTTLINQLCYSQSNNSSIFIHANTGISHIELFQFKSGRVGTSIQYLNSTPHLQQVIHDQHSEKRNDKSSTFQSIKSGNALYRDHWIKIFQKQ